MGQTPRKTWGQLTADMLKGVLDRPLIKYLALTTLITFVGYSVFFYFAPAIWRIHDLSQSTDITPWMKLWVNPAQHDGYEPYVLFGLVWFILVFSAGIFTLLTRIVSVHFRLWVSGALFICAMYAGYFLIAFVPMVKVDCPFSWSLVLGLGAISGILAMAWKWANKRWFFWLITVISAPIFFIATEPIAHGDYSYFFVPALKILQHVPWSQIYFQYDLLPSLLASIWLKFPWDLNTFAWLGQASYFALAVGMLGLGKKIFRVKYLAYVLFFSFIIIKLYSNITDPIRAFQVTPLRLDGWFILLLILYFKGIRHWLFGFALASLLILQKTFGLIYVLSYFELILLVLFFEAMDGGAIRQPKIFFRSAMNLLRSVWVNVVLIGAGAAVSWFLFHAPKDDPASNFFQYGLGFMPISRQSFYWSIIIGLSVVWFLIIKYRHRLTERSFRLGLFLVTFSIGNSLYFFGRSDENNIINISAILLFGLFYGIDLAQQLNSGALISKRFNRWVLPGIGLIIVAGLYVSYSGSIANKTRIQLRNVLAGRIHQPSDFVMPARYAAPLETIGEITDHSPLVYFAILDNDFYFYYFGGYAPVGYRQPYATWLFKSQNVAFLNALLAQHYYIVFRNDTPPDSDVEYGFIRNFGEYIIVWK